MTRPATPGSTFTGPVEIVPAPGESAFAELPDEAASGVNSITLLRAEYNKLRQFVEDRLTRDD